MTNNSSKFEVIGVLSGFTYAKVSTLEEAKRRIKADMLIAYEIWHERLNANTNSRQSTRIEYVNPYGDQHYSNNGAA